MSNFLQIMYVGNKPNKVDNVNANAKGRVWEALGAVVEVSPLEAQKLKAHPDIWLDVTNLDEKARTKIVDKILDQMRATRRAHQTNVLLKDASVQEIEDELYRRKNGAERPALVKTQRAPPGPDRRGDEGNNGIDGNAAERPGTPALVVDAIVTAIRSLDPDKAEYFDASTGNPTKEAIESVLHYPISKTELKAGIAAHAELAAA